MAVFTPVAFEEAAAFLEGYDLPALVRLEPVAEGVENTNYRAVTAAGDFVLTLVERRTDPAALPYVTGLTAWLAARGVPVPEPVADREGRRIGTLKGRPALVGRWLPGAWPRAPDAAQAGRAGALLARLHLAATGYPGRRENPYGPEGWRRLARRCAEAAEGEDRRVLDRVERALAALSPRWPRDLPSGPIHADYFPDNVLFEGAEPTGVIDFYFASDDAFAYDLAVALCAWGFDGAGTPLPPVLDAFRRGYEGVRPLGEAEARALPRLCAGAAIRFTLSRLHDRVFHDPSWAVTPKDPVAFLRRLEFYAEAAKA